MNVGWLLGINFNVPIWIILLVATVVSYYLYMTWNNGIFKKLGIPGPDPKPIFGTLKHMIEGGFEGHDTFFLKKYGDVVGVFEGRSPVLLVQDPEIIKQILVKQFNNFANRTTILFDDEIANNMLQIASENIWRNLRNTISPSFSGGKLKRMIRHMNSSADQFVKNLEKPATDGGSFNLEDFTKSFAMDVIAGTAFGIELNSQLDKENQFVTMANKGFNFGLKSPIMIILFFFPFMVKYITRLGMTVFPKDVVTFFGKVTEKIMQERENNPKIPPDFIQLMMNSHTEVKDYDQNEALINGDTEADDFSGKKRKLTKTEILANALIFFLAGYDTTSNTLAFAAHLLAVNPECQEKLYKEIERVFSEKEPTYEQLHDIPYLEQVLDETLRLYPQGPRLERVAKEKVTIKGITIPAGMRIGIGAHCLHYDPRIYPEPEKFDPDRFSEEQKALRDPYTYLPFGTGPRNCVGMRLAQMELKIALIKLIRMYKLLPCAETQIPLKTEKRRIRSEKGVFLKLQQR